MRDYGKDTLKPTWLYSSSEFLSDIDLFKMPAGGVSSQGALVKNFTNTSGRKCVTGLKVKLKESQSYPAGFGKAGEIKQR